MWKWKWLLEVIRDFDIFLRDERRESVDVSYPFSITLLGKMKCVFQDFLPSFSWRFLEFAWSYKDKYVCRDQSLTIPLVPCLAEILTQPFFTFLNAEIVSLAAKEITSPGTRLFRNPGATPFHISKTHNEIVSQKFNDSFFLSRIYILPWLKFQLLWAHSSWMRIFFSAPVFVFEYIFNDVGVICPSRNN